MKRKIEDTEEAVAPSKTQGEQAPTKEKLENSFADLDLDHRLLQALAQQKFQQPTLVQQKAIPLAIGGRDVIAKAKTGSGKTLAYILPLLQYILKRKQTDPSATTTCLILVPSRELCDQVYKAIGTCATFCSKEIRSVKLSDQVSDAVQKSLLSSGPDIVISTPAKAWNSINASALSLENLKYLVVDEADLILSYGYQEELENVARSLPKGVQKILTSATLTTEVDTLKTLFCRDPAVLDLEEPEAEGEGVQQYVVKCGEDEKFLIGYVIFKLGLLKGKCIVFVDDIDRCYRLKLFWEQFGIRSCILNSELPVNCRIHTVEEFNANVYDIIIASDENEVLGDEDQLNDDGADAATDGTSADGGKTKDAGAAEGKSARSKKRRKASSSKDYGVSRGIDFKNVACVVNFDLPRSSKSYTHRIGRTARAGQTGMALSFVIPSDKYRKHMPTSIESAEHDEKILAKIIKQQSKRGKEVKPYNFDMAQLENFRYRMNDALRAVTKVSIREARTRELRQELLKSEALKRHFEENPAELHHLRHDGELRTSRTQAHLRHVPDYLLPKDGKKALTSEEVGFVPFRRQDRDARTSKKRFFTRAHKGKGFKVGGRKSDPLRTFKAKRKAK